MDDHAHDGPTVGDGDGYRDDQAPDRLVAARIALAEVAELPLLDRATVFEHVHATVVEELRQLEFG